MVVEAQHRATNESTSLASGLSRGTEGARYCFFAAGFTDAGHYPGAERLVDCRQDRGSRPRSGYRADIAMIELRIGGQVRPIPAVSIGQFPANRNRPRSEPMAASALPQFPVQGIHWTSYRRPKGRPAHRSHPHLTLVE